jgi:hypothetical protein
VVSRARRAVESTRWPAQADAALATARATMRALAEQKMQVGAPA